MGNNRDITSANSTAIMVVEELFPSGFAVEMFAADTAISQGDDTVAETRMGVDGKMVAGFVPSIKSITVTLEAPSPTISYMETLYQASQSNRRTYKVHLTITIPSIGKTYKYTNGVLKTAKPLPDLKKVLEPQNFAFDFEYLAVERI